MPAAPAKVQIKAAMSALIGQLAGEATSAALTRAWQMLMLLHGLGTYSEQHLDRMLLLKEGGLSSSQNLA
jgi:hypothetical protein